MAPETAEVPSPPPPEKASWSWRTRYFGLIDHVSSLGLPMFTHHALRPPPPPTAPADAGPPTPAGSGTRAPPLGLIVVRPTAEAGITRPTRLARPAAYNATVDDDEQQPPSAAVYNPPELLVGGELVEVFSVTATYHFVGTIDVCDWRSSSKTIFSRKDWDEGYKSFFLRKKKWQANDSGHSALSEFEDQLVLTGPHSAISPCGGFIVRLFIPSTRKKDCEVLRLHWHSEVKDPSIYNRPMTRTIVTQRGRVHVTCAVMDDAVQATVRVTLRLPHEAALCAKVHGHINARVDTFSVGCALFSRDADEPVDVSVSRDSLTQGCSDSEFSHSIVLPLDRDVLVVPVGACVQVSGELVFNGSNVVHVSHSIKVEVERVRSQGVVQDGYCSTTVDMWFREPCG